MKNFQLQVVDDEIKWVNGDVSYPLEVFRPNEYQAQKLYKQLKEFFEKK